MVQVFNRYSAAFQPATLTGRIIFDLRNVQKTEKTFKEIKKRLTKNYTPKKLGKVQKKYMRKPAELRNKIREMSNNFVKDYQDFTKAYKELFRHINNTLTASQQKHYTGLVSVKSLMNTIASKARSNPDRFYFPKEGRKEFGSQFRKAMNELARQLRRDYAKVKSMSQGKTYYRSFFTRFISNSAAERKGIQAAKSVQTQVNLVQQASKHIKDQLGPPLAIEQDFIALLLEYVTELEKTDKLFKNLKVDIEIILQSVILETNKVADKIAPFIVLVESSPTLKPKLEKARKDFIDLQTNTRTTLGKESVWPKYISATAVSIQGSEQALIAELANIEESKIRGKVNDVIKRYTV